MKKLKICYLVSFMISLIALVVGAVFHGYRMHPENTANYNLGVTRGIAMLSICVLFF